MIKEFYVYSRQAIEALPAHDVPHVIISVSTPNSPYIPANVRMNHHTMGLLRLRFVDLDRPIPGRIEENELFQPWQARACLSMIMHEDAERLVVHCEAGISRSPAIAAAASRILTDDDGEFFKRYHPNMRVYRMILEEWQKGNEHGNGDH